MAKFSDRLGFTQAPKEIQIDSMTDDLRTSLWNWVVEVMIFDGYRDSVTTVWKDYFKKPLNQLSTNDRSNIGWIYNHLFQSDWYESYNLVEFILLNVTTIYGAYEEFALRLNQILERELSGYRLINCEIVPISDTNEVESIRQAMTEPASTGVDGASEHIKKALSLLGRKPQPDYANSIKESISAVESICKVVTGEKSGGIDKALAKLDAQVSFHPALKKGISNLYGYTSDEGGIRHAILEQKDIGFAEAKFMLVTCSAFVNFFLDKARQAKLI